MNICSKTPQMMLGVKVGMITAETASAAKDTECNQTGLLLYSEKV